MSSDALILVGSDAEALEQGAIEQTLACWPARQRPTVVRATLAQMLADASLFEQARLLWLVADTDSRDVREFLGQCQDHRRPAALSLRDDTRLIGSADETGVTVAPLSSPPVALCAMLRALWNQFEVVRALKAEIDILNLHNGGLASQFDKLDEELRLAAQLQREFLPSSLPTAHGIDFRVLFRPASYVSGDIYDVIRLDDEHVGFFIADAVGHGVPAALMTVYIKRSFRTGKRSDDNSNQIRIIAPAEALEHLNRDMIRQQNGQVRFATACYGVLNCRTHRLTFSRAGHPYPLILRADGTNEWIEPEGGLLGVFPEETFETAEVDLNPGDRLLLYSDGFDFAFPDPQQKHTQRKRLANNSYTDVFKTLAQGTLDEAFDRLLKQLDEQHGSLNQIDDLTAVLISIGDIQSAIETEAAAHVM